MSIAPPEYLGVITQFNIPDSYCEVLYDNKIWKFNLGVLLEIIIQDGSYIRFKFEDNTWYRAYFNLDNTIYMEHNNSDKFDIWYYHRNKIYTPVEYIDAPDYNIFVMFSRNDIIPLTKFRYSNSDGVVITFDGRVCKNNYNNYGYICDADGLIISFINDIFLTIRMKNNVIYKEDQIWSINIDGKYMYINNGNLIKYQDYTNNTKYNDHGEYFDGVNYYSDISIKFDNIHYTKNFDRLYSITQPHGLSLELKGNRLLDIYHKQDNRFIGQQICAIGENILEIDHDDGHRKYINKNGVIIFNAEFRDNRWIIQEYDSRGLILLRRVLDQNKIYESINYGIFSYSKKQFIKVCQERLKLFLE